MSSINRGACRHDMAPLSRTIEPTEHRQEANHAGRGAASTGTCGPRRAVDTSRLRIRYAGKVVVTGQEVVYSDHLIEFERGA
ncbi:MAG: hypothetical protein V4764_04285 [Burkholderia sp.]